MQNYSLMMRFAPLLAFQIVRPVRKRVKFAKTCYFTFWHNLLVLPIYYLLERGYSGLNKLRLNLVLIECLPENRSIRRYKLSITYL